MGDGLELVPVQNVAFWCDMIGHTFAIQHDFSDHTMQVAYNKICLIRMQKPFVKLEQSPFALYQKNRLQTQSLTKSCLSKNCPVCIPRHQTAMSSIPHFEDSAPPEESLSDIASKTIL